MSTRLAFYVDTSWGVCGFFKNFPLQRLHFIPHEAVQNFDLHLALGSAFCSPSVWDPAVSLSAYSSNISPLILQGWEEGAGLTCQLFFLQTTQRAVVLTSGLSVLLASNAVLFWSAAIRMHCETTGVWFKVVFPPMLGVVIVEGNQLSAKGWVLRKFLQL